jgi:hypothetical protein
MKADVTTPGSLNQYRTHQGPPRPGSEQAAQLPGSKQGSGKDYQVELSGQKPLNPEAELPAAPSPVAAPAVPKVDMKEVAKASAKKKLETKAVEKAKAVTEKDMGPLKRPAIIFIKGLDVFSSPSKSERGYAGVGRMAEAVEGSRIYGWDQKKEIIQEVMRTHKDYPVILVGHSLGGDTAVEVAEELNSLKHKFRPVDLLITIDSVGFNNDLIPQNVDRNLNVFGNKDFFFNDGPNAARRPELTDVINLLSPLDHTEIDDDKEVQFDIITLIQETLDDAPKAHSV